jgi:hypothetical protein
MSLVTCNQLKAVENRIKTIESQMGGMIYDMREVVRGEITANGTVIDQSQMQYGLYTGLCIDTVDIWKQNRIRFYSPLFHTPEMKVEQLPWANAVSNMGGFDDCGMTWVPPAGSTVCIMFENGNRSAPYYIGTTWHRNRGPDGKHVWGYNIDEYYKIWEGKRRGYLVGPDDGSQVFPPWNTENYNGFDLTSAVDFSSNPEAQRLITYPNIYGFKTPEKHMIKMVDGDPRCNRKWKRFEIMSSCGNWIMLKDDHMHYAGQWANVDCGGIVQDGDVSCDEGGAESTNTASLSPRFGKKKEENACEEKKSNKKIIGGHPRTGAPGTTYSYPSQVGANPYFKHRQECRPYRGSPTPQNNSVDLPQSGIQFHSISGHTFVMDDSVEEPSGSPTWEREFDFGCNNKYVGRTYWKSATGHQIEMSDVEGKAGDENDALRGEDNFIRIKSASGNRIELNDHTESKPKCSECPPNTGGERRGIILQSTSNHIIQMSDEGNEQCGPCRVEGGVPVAKAKKAFVKIRTGYGLEMSFNDDNNQGDTSDTQNIKIFTPNKKNTKGPNLMIFQDAPGNSSGLVFLRVAGNYVCITVDNHLTVVGDEEKEPASSIQYVTKYNLVYTKDAYINVTERSHLFIAKDKILLLAGRDCPPPEGTPEEKLKQAEKSACLAPICVLKDGAIRASDRVFASCSPDASVLSIFQLKPFFKDPPKNPPPPTPAAG